MARNMIERIQMKDITKTYGATVALDEVSVSINKGVIHGLVGQNGAGKTTLMRVIYGLTKPDAGRLSVDGEEVRFRSPQDAIEHRIFMVQQHFSLIPSFTVAETIGLIHPSSKNFLYEIDDVKTHIENLSNKYGLEVNPNVHIWKLSAGERQRVEILKALTAKANTLLLDEPSAVLTPAEVTRLFEVLKSMVAKEGLAILVSTHRMDEVLELCTWLTVLRNGKKVYSGPVEGLDLKEIKRLIVGEDIETRQGHSSRIQPKITKKPILGIKNLEVLSDLGHIALRDVSFSLYNGEILGIAGEAGNGQKELVEAIFGLRKVLRGKILLNGKDVTHFDPRTMFEHNVRYIPEEGYRRGGCKDLSIADNIILNRYRYKPFSVRTLLNNSERDKFSGEIIEHFDVQTESPFKLLRHLSGGNIVRTIVGRELTGSLEVLMAVHPTAGLDVKSTDFVCEQIRKLKDKGKACLVVSEDLAEICKICDRVLVISRGEIIAEVENKDQISRSFIGSLISGAAD